MLVSSSHKKGVLPPLDTAGLTLPAEMHGKGFSGSGSPGQMGRTQSAGSTPVSDSVGWGGAQEFAFVASS